MTKKFTYGCKPPFDGIDLVREQMRLAHRYQNQLVELELGRRKRVEETLAKLFPEGANLDREITNVEAELETLRNSIKAGNAEQRKRTATPEQRADAARLKGVLKDLRMRRKILRAACFSSTDWHFAQSGIDAWQNSEQKRLRAECGCYWGNYQLAEIAMERCRSGPPPRFKRWDGTAMVSCQIMSPRTMTPEQLLAGEDSRARLELDPSDSSRPKPHAILWLRQGTTAEGESLWVKARIRYHRPLPHGSSIRRVYLRVVRIGTREEWSVQFDVAYEPAELPAPPLDTVGIDLGWRKLDAGLRVACWVDTNEREGELMLPMERIEAWQYADSYLEAIRDRHFNDVLKWLAAWRATRISLLPTWFTEATETLASWKSQARLASLVLRWRNECFYGDNTLLIPGDPHMPIRELLLDVEHYGEPIGAYDVLEAWRKKDKHLCDWAASQRLKVQRWRDDLYRVTARRLAEQYQCAKMEDCNWREMMEHADAEDNQDTTAQRMYHRFAAVGRLRQFITEAMRETKLVKSAKTTMRCALCGEDSGQRDRSKLIHECGKCGASWDQDRNAAWNILTSDEVVDGIEGALANVDAKDVTCEKSA